MPEAARVDDPIEHSLALVGLLVGAVIGAAFAVATVATGGGALVVAVAVAGAVSTGGTVGQLIGSLVPAVTAGAVKKGSDNVSTNNLAAARAVDDVAMCAQHPAPPPAIAQGSETVFINSYAAARVGDKLVCSGTIASGSGDVFIGGGQGTYLEIEGEVPEWLEWTIAGLGLAAGIGGIGLLVKGLAKQVIKKGGIKAFARSMFGRKGVAKATAADPVYLPTGAVFSERLDFEIPWRIPLRWHASYFSDRTRVGALGRGWESPADVRLEKNPDGTVTFWDGEPYPVLFSRLVGEGESVHEGLEGNTLVHTRAGYEVRGKSGLVHRFGAFADVEALVERIEDPHGNVLHYVRREGRLAEIRESKGTWLELDYADGVVHEVRLHHPQADQAILQVGYRHEDGDLVEAIDASGHRHRYAYENHSLVRHEDRNGVAFVYEYDRAEAGGRCVRAAGPEGLFDYRFSYDPDGGWVRYTNSLGHETRVELDEHGYPIREVDPLGAITSYAYDTWGLTTEVTDSLGRATKYRYDGYGDVVEIERPDGLSTTMEYDARQCLVELTDTAGEVWRQEWDEQWRLLRQVSPTGAVRSYGYGRHGDLVAHTDPRGNTERYEQDHHFAVMRVHHDRGGTERRWEMDALGRVVAFSDADGSITHYRHDASGRITGVRTPLDTEVRCEYDGEGNLVSYQDENGHETRFEYTGLNEIERQRLPDGNAIEYRYDTEDELAAVVNERGQVHRLRRDAAGRVTEEIDYWGQRSELRRNEVGEVVEAVDELGQSVGYEYDRLGRMICRETGEGEKETIEYDVADNLVRMGNDQGESTRRYDVEGRVVEERQGEVAFSYVHDEGGNCIERRSSLGNVVESAYDANDQLVELKINGVKAATIERDVRGLPVGEQLGAGAIRRRTEYDAMGRMTRQRVSTDVGWSSDRGYAYDGVGDLLERKDVHLGADRYLYDPRGRLMQWADPWGAIQSFVHDPTGTLMQPLGGGRREGPGRAGEMVVPKKAVVRSSEHGGIEHHHDAAGSVVERGTAKGRQQLRWDGLQRLREVTLEDGERWKYEYDAMGRRRAKGSAAGRTEFFWNGERLAAEVAGEGEQAVGKEYVYAPGSFEPFAVVDAGRTLYFNNEPIGLPRELLDERGEVVWRARYSAAGEVVEEIGGAVQNYLRFPGQYHDAETGVCYNRFRYIEPGAQRFLSKDPLGLAAGVDVHAYAPNVWGWVDPLGLSCGGLAGRAGALNQAKRDLGIPRAQHPTSMTKVPMTQRGGTRVLGADGKPTMTREYTYVRPDGSKVTIQDHSAGHSFGRGGRGDQGAHFNVRPPENTRTGSVPRTQDHYPFRR